MYLKNVEKVKSTALQKNKKKNFQLMYEICPKNAEINSITLLHIRVHFVII